MNYIVEEYDNNKLISLTAKNKARSDILNIMKEIGCTPIRVTSYNDRVSGSFVRKLYNHLSVLKEWKPVIKATNRRDTIILQFPIIAHSMFFSLILMTLRLKGVETIAVIHDLDFLRNHFRSDLSNKYKARIIVEEVSALRLFNKVVVHNDYMESYLSAKHYLRPSRLKSLKLFDYLVNDNCKKHTEQVKINFESKTVVIAGNMDRAKSEYIYHLPSHTQYFLYGPNYSASDTVNIKYKGSFPPETLPSVLEGTFGLVWDGDSIETCSGPFGNYLRINNPHKTSLYLASGLPVLIWKEAALADFVQKHHVGYIISSLDDIPYILNNMTYTDYRSMTDNVSLLADQLKNGYHTKQALVPYIKP